MLRYIIAAVFFILCVIFYFAPLASAQHYRVVPSQIEMVPTVFADYPENYVEASDLIGITSPEKAAHILRAARAVMYFYAYTIQAARMPVPEEFADFFAEQPIGYCEVGALVFSRLLGAEYGARNYNVLPPRYGVPTFGVAAPQNYSGHTASALKLERGALLVDPMFGILLVTKREDFSQEVMREGDFEVFSLFSPEDPPDMRSSFATMTQLYKRLSENGAYSAYSGDRIIAGSSTISVAPFGVTTLGILDDSQEDISRILGGWNDHVGYWYEPVTHEWKVSGKWPGIYELTMDLIDGDGPVLGIPLDLGIELDGGVILSTSVESRSLTVRYATLGTATIKTTSQGTSGRRIDRVIARQLSPL